MYNHDYSNTPVDNSQVPRQDSFAGKNPQYITQPPNGQGQRPDTEPAYHSRYPQSWQPPYSPYYWRDFPQYGYYHYPYGAYPRPAVPATPAAAQRAGYRDCFLSCFNRRVFISLCAGFEFYPRAAGASARYCRNEARRRVCNRRHRYRRHIPDNSSFYFLSVSAFLVIS